MKWQLYFVLSAVVVLADKERIEEEQISEITEKLFKVLEKRLNNWDDEQGADECAFSFSNGTIIRTRDSITAGGIFIKSPAVDARESCQEMCCNIGNCNLAVYKEKGDENSCYLFDCRTPSVCVFTSHPGFIAMNLPNRDTGNLQQAKHEEDLQDLAVTTTSTTAEPTTTVTPTTSTTMSTTTTLLPPQKTQPVALFGECESHKDCAGSATECLAGYCVCQEGYHAQDGACHKDKDENNKYKGSLEDKHEDNAVAQEKHPAFHPKDDSTDVKISPILQSSPASKVDSKPDKVIDVLPTPVKTDETKKPAVSDTALSKDSNEKSISNVDSAIAPPDAENVHTNLTSDTNADQSKSTPAPEADTKLDGGNNAVQLPLAPADDEDDEVEQTAIYIGAIKKNQGAIIALALGLTVTAMLLIFVGCRLRNVKRRLRKGRPMNTNEADYLINGMYL